MNTRLEKHKVCLPCQAVGIKYIDCVCTYKKNYPTIELEFEVCNCCNNLVSDEPADTEFNNLQFSNYKEE